jgi:Zn-dependent peptidase ImmA (M78 family)
MKELMELNSYAVKLRRTVGEDLFSPIDVFSLISDIQNATLVFYPLSERISGMCYRIDDSSLIAINSTLTSGRQRFSAAHELYHLYYQTTLTSFICETDLYGKKSEDEYDADAFASYLLAPYEALRKFIDDLSISHISSVDQVIRVEQHFRMSRQATLYRLLREGLISENLAKQMKANVIISAKRLGYDDSLYTPTVLERQKYTIGNYIELAEKLKSLGIISNGKYEGLLLEAFRPDLVYNLNSGAEAKYD